MKRSISMSVLTAASMVASVGLATSARAIDVGPTNVYLWTSHDYGAGAGNAPGAVGYNGGATPTWAWQASSMATQPWIDSNGRIYFSGTFRSTPPIGAMTATTNVNGIFTASSGINNSPDVAPFMTFVTGQNDPATGAKIGNNAMSSGNQSLGGSSALRVSGSGVVGLGLQIGNPLADPGVGTVSESPSRSGVGATLQNNTQLYTGSFGSRAAAARQSRVISTPTSNDWTVASGTTDYNDITNFRTAPSSQNSDLNSSGTWLVPIAFATVGPNPASAPTSATASVAATSGNNTALATIGSTGTTTIIARAGDLPFGAGGPQFKGSNNGVGGFYMKMNRNGQVAYDASFLNVGTTGNPGPGGITSANDSSAWIYTPGAGTRDTQNSLVYGEGLNVPTHIDPISGLSTSAGTATFSGSATSGGIGGGFSNAGWIYSANGTGGDTVSSGGGAAGQNDQFVMISTAAGGLTPTWVQRRNDIAPGFTAGSNVHMGGVNASSLHMNNNGMVAFPGGLQSTSTGAVQPSVAMDIDFFGDGSVLTPGVVGNDYAVFAGMPGLTGSTGLKAIARKGDIAPGFGGTLRIAFDGSTPNPALNNNGDVVFGSTLTQYAPGTVLGVVGQQPPSDSGAFINVLWAYNASSYGLVPLLYTGQAIEVETGVFKYVNQFQQGTAANGDGGVMNLNDAGQLVVWVRLADSPDPLASATSTSYIVLQVPSAGTGSLGLLGLAAMARRRRRR